MLLPVIHFPGTCARAMALYQEVLGATVVSVDFLRDAPPESGMAASEAGDAVLHAELDIMGVHINLSDVDEPVVPGNMHLLNLFLESPEAVAAVFAGLGKGGRVEEELAPQFFSPLYGAVEDRYGVRWQLIAK